MDLQLIFVVETDKKSKSDWIYIKNTIDWFYKYDNSHVKFSTVYMAGKGHYKEKETAILHLISQYCSRGKNRMSKVIYCFDCDDYNTKSEDKKFLDNARQYCEGKEYDFVWFCKDIEHVYWGGQVEANEKGKQAERFMSRNIIKTLTPDKLTADYTESGYKIKASNIMNILDKYLMRK